MAATSLPGEAEYTQDCHSGLTLNTVVCAMTMDCSKNSPFYFIELFYNETHKHGEALKAHPAAWE